MRKLAHVDCFHIESCPNLPKMDRSSLLSSLHSLDWTWSLLIFCSFHHAFTNTTLHLLLDFRNFFFIPQRRVPEYFPRCIRRPKSQQSRFSGRVVRICRKAGVLGLGEWSLRDARRETSEVSGLWNQGFLFQSVRGPQDYNCRLVDWRGFDRILRWMCYYSGWVQKKKFLSSLSPVRNKYLQDSLKT